MFRVFRHPFFWHEWPMVRTALPSSRLFDNVAQEVERFEQRALERFNRWPFRTIESVESKFDVVDNKDKFAVNMDISEFKPEEIKVKTIKNELVIEGAHERNSDEQGFLSAQFVRRVVIPENVDLGAMVSRLNADGTQLTIEAPKKIVQQTTEKTIPIEHIKE